MAANKFATMLHRNTNKLTLILVYALLEWILIVLLLLNSLFSFLILKFADFFGLKRPCLFCSRLDHVFDSSTTSRSSYRDLLCHDHASEIGRLGYCSSHRKLAESQHMCEDCSSSSRPTPGELPNIDFLPWVKRIAKVSENGEVGSAWNCSCCGVGVDGSKLYSPCVLIKPSWGVFDYPRDGGFVAEAGVDEGIDQSDRSRSEFAADNQAEEDEREQGIGKSRGVQVGSDVDEDDSAGEEDKDADEVGSGSKVGMVVEKERDLIKLDDDDEDDGDDGGDLSFTLDDLCSNPGTTRVESTMDASPEIMPQHLEFFIGHDDYRLIPVELIDSATEENQIRYTCEEANRDVVLNFDVGVEPIVKERCTIEEKEPLIPIHESVDEGVESSEVGDLAENARSLALEEEELDVQEEDELAAAAQATETQSIHDSDVQETVREMDADFGTQSVDANDVPEAVREMDADIESQSVGANDVQEAIREMDADIDTQSVGANDVQETVREMDADIDIQSVDANDVHETAREIDADAHLAEEEEDTEMQNDDMEADVSIGTEIPDHEPVDENQDHEDPSYQMVQEGPSSSHDDMLGADDDHGSKEVEQEVEFKTLSVETSPHPLFSQLSRSLELNDIEEDKVPDTPSSVDSLHQFSRRALSLERRESGTESLDGSVISDIEPGELTVEKLSSALKAERKALNALYAELEEERSASAVAANQTMAMINRLHEEKAAMQMEALQYQRMMEEQSEYDQEALQLLNELMVKREKEKQELEKELEAYRRKVQEYEAREKMLMLRRKEAGIRSMTSSVSCSNADDSDGSVDLNREVKEDDSHFNHQDCNGNHNTPTDAVLYLEESLANFEEERMSILEELKVLEEKLFTMNSEEEENFEDGKTFENGHENGHSYNENGISGETNGVANGHYKEMNGKHHQGTRMVSKPKRLLPLFDAIELEAEDGVLNGNEHGFDSASQHDSSDSRFELEHKRPAIEEEVDHVYERLQALEADREFLKHCMSSLKKGDKGVYLLQEILQHLRDLRKVDLRARNMEDGLIQ